MGLVKRLLAVLFGIFLALLLLEITLHLIPTAIWKAWVVKSPMHYRLFLTDENIGWVHLPNATSNWQGTGEYNVEVKLNSLGLRDRERTLAKPDGVFRILLLGDSFTEGIQVNLENSFPTLLEGCLAKQTHQTVEVINGGVSAYGPGEELLFYMNEGVKYQPDLVLSAIYAVNDIHDMNRDWDDNMVQSFGGYRFDLVQGELQKQWISWSDPGEAIPWWEQLLRRYSNLYYIFRAPDSQVREEINDLQSEWWPSSKNSQPGADEKSGSAKSSKPAFDGTLAIFTKDYPHNLLISSSAQYGWQLFAAVFQELQAQTAAQQTRLGVFIIPGGGQVHPEIYKQWVAEFDKKYDLLAVGLDAWDISAPNKAISRFMEEQGIPTLDLLPGFLNYTQTSSDLLYFREDIHFNERGHRLAADLMCQWLLNEKLVPLP